MGVHSTQLLRSGQQSRITLKQEKFQYTHKFGSRQQLKTVDLKCYSSSYAHAIS